MKEKKFGIVYLKIEPEYAKTNNLPVKLPILLEDYDKAFRENRLDLNIILRGLEAQMKVKNDENKKEYYTSYLIFYYYEAFKLSMQDKEYEEAKKYLEKAKNVFHDYRYHFYNALYLKELGHLEFAELEFKQALDMNKEFSTGYYELGNLMFERKIYDEALEYYEKSLEIEKEFLLPYLKIADIYMENARYEDSINYLNECIKLDKEFIPPYVRLGVIFNLLQRYNDANIIHNKALEITRENPEIFYNNAFSLTKLGRYNDAIFNLEKAFELNPKDYVLHELSMAYKNLGMFYESYETEIQALESAEEENKIMILISLLKLSCIMEDVENFYYYYNLVIKTPYFLSAHTFKMFFELSIERVEEAKIAIDELNKNGLFINLKNRIEKISDIIDYLEKNVNVFVSEVLFESFDEDGQLLPEDMSDNLVKRGFKGEYLSWLKDKSFKAKNKPEGLFLLTNSLILSGFNYALSERMSSAISGYLWKDGEGLAFSKLLLRFYHDRIFGENSPLEIFIEEVIEEVKDMNYKYARIITDYEDFLMDYDSICEYKINNLEDALKIFLSAVRIDLSLDEIKTDFFADENAREILRFVGVLNKIQEVEL
jgi:tetratricopeptide (TPR) repeat protein